MDFNYFNISSVLIFSLLIQTAFSSIQDSYLSRICTPGINITSDFDKNLQIVLTNLTDNAPQNYGFFYIASSSYGNYTDYAYGMALCRGDIPRDNCTDCLSEAMVDITQDCPTKRSIIWYDYCYMKFADYDFHGFVDTANIFSTSSADDAPHPQKFYDKAIRLLRRLSNETGDKEGMFAKVKGNVSSSSVTIYAMAQCSRDISKDQCKKCLDSAVDELPGFKCINEKVILPIPIGGRTLTGSCFVRYEIKPFLITNDD